MVQAARRSTADAMAYLKSTWRGERVGMFVAPPETQGRFLYNDTLTGMNFGREMAPLDVVLDALLKMADDPKAPAVYVGSTALDTYLPGFRAANDLPFGDRHPLASVWLGNRSRIAAHFDLPDNLACVVAGRRRFTLFPPEQIANLYIGPLDVNPAVAKPSASSISPEPDFERFPRFAQALEHAQVVELEPGDAVFIPSQWWHHVEALSPFNALVNYWWRQSPRLHGFADRRADGRAADDAARPGRPRSARSGAACSTTTCSRPTSPPPPTSRGSTRSALAPITESGARHLRQALINRFKR